MKKLLSVFLACSLILSAICGVAAAEEVSPVTCRIEFLKGGRISVLEYDEILPQGEPVLRRGAQPSFEEYMNEKLTQHIKEIDVSAYRLTFDEFEDKYYGVVTSNYKILASTSCMCYMCNGYVYYVEPIYTFESLEEDTEKRNYMDSVIQSEYLDTVAHIPDSDVVGKMLIIHDLFCSNNQYAQTEADEDKAKIALHPEIYTAYGLFTNHRAVCQGNATALKAIYDMLNEQMKAENGTSEDIIKTGLCANETHIWNVVKINGKWYHIDETNDDAGNYARHNKFLVSSPSLHASAYSEDNDFFGPEDSWTYYVFDENIECNNDDYESGYIFNTLSDYFETCSISYNDAHYILNPNLSNYDKSFLFDSILATKAFATDVYNAEGQDRVDLFLGESFNTSVVFANYDENGSLIDCKKMPKTLMGGYLNPIYDFSEYSRIFVWQAGGIEPLCRVIDIPAAE